jgi:hypothetical protein
MPAEMVKPKTGLPKAIDVFAEQRGRGYEPQSLILI